MAGRAVRPGDLAGTLAWPGSWRIARRHWRYGAGELRRSLSKRAFTDAVRRLLPEAGPADLRPAPAGSARRPCCGTDAGGRLPHPRGAAHGPRAERALARGDGLPADRPPGGAPGAGPVGGGRLTCRPRRAGGPGRLGAGAVDTSAPEPQAPRGRSRGHLGAGAAGASEREPWAPRRRSHRRLGAGVAGGGARASAPYYGSTVPETPATSAPTAMTTSHGPDTRPDTRPEPLSAVPSGEARDASAAPDAPPSAPSRAEAERQDRAALTAGERRRCRRAVAAGCSRTAAARHRTRPARTSSGGSAASSRAAPASRPGRARRCGGCGAPGAWTSTGSASSTSTRCSTASRSSWRSASAWARPRRAHGGRRPVDRHPRRGRPHPWAGQPAGARRARRPHQRAGRQRRRDHPAAGDAAARRPRRRTRVLPRPVAQEAAPQAAADPAGVPGPEWPRG